MEVGCVEACVNERFQENRVHNEIGGCIVRERMEDQDILLGKIGGGSGLLRSIPKGRVDFRARHGLRKSRGWSTKVRDEYHQENKV